MKARTIKTYLGTLLITEAMGDVDSSHTVRAAFTPRIEGIWQTGTTEADALDTLASELRSIAGAIEFHARTARAKRGR